MMFKTRQMPPLVREEKEVLDPEMLYLTYEELEEIVQGNIERFEVTFDHIPLPEPGEKDYNINQYMEKDGRQYRQLHFTDTLTKKEYYMGYTYAPYGWDFPCNINFNPNGVIFVDESVLKEKPSLFDIKSKTFVECDEKGKSAKKIMRIYSRMGLDKEFCIETTDIPDERLMELKERFQKMKDSPFDMWDLQLLIIPTCIEYKVKDDVLWSWIHNPKTKVKTRKPTVTQAQTNKKIANLSRSLVESLVDKYSISSYDEFTCPIIRDIAKELKFFG